MKERNKAYR